MAFSQRAAYRTRQFFSVLHAEVDVSEIDALRAILPPAAWLLFQTMPISDQRHSLNVCHALLQRGLTDSNLLAAALLHDVAKAGHVFVWHRVLLVLLKITLPGKRLLDWLARPAQKSSWRYAFFVSVNHPALGASMTREAGCSERTAWLIEHHQETEDTFLDAELVALREVDDAS